MTLWAPSISVGLWLQLWSLCLTVSETVVTGYQEIQLLFTISNSTPFPRLSLDSAKKYDVDGNLFEIITSDETRYFLQAATAEERKEWINAVQAVSKSGK